VRFDPLENTPNSSSVEQVHEHFPKGVAFVLAFCDARLVQSIETVRKRRFRMKLSEHVRSTHSQDGAIALDILHGQMFRLNVVGSRMLELLKQGMTEAQIADAISRDSGAPREIVATDLREFLSHLERNHLLEIRQATSDSSL
jgi:hypothetical protein